MGDIEYSQLPYRNVVLIGVGTVFGTLGVILAAAVGGAVLWPVGPELPLLENVRFFFLYAFFGGLLALGLCLAMALPMLLLWKPVFNNFRKKGYALPSAAMISAGVLSFVATLGLLVTTEWLGTMRLPLVGWPLAALPVTIAALLARRLSFDRSGAVWQ